MAEITDKIQTVNTLAIRRALNDFITAIANTDLSVSVQNDIRVTNLDELKLSDHRMANRLDKSLNSAIDRQTRNISPALSELRNVASRLKFPEDISVDNLGPIIDGLSSLEKAIGKIDVRPIINPPNVNVEAPRVDAKVDLSALLSALKPLQFLSNKATQPIAVRNSDGKSFVKALEKIEKAAKAQTVTMSNFGLTKDELRTVLGTPTSMTTGKLALTNATTAVQVSSTSTRIKWIDVSAVGQPIAVGDSSCAVDLSTPANSRGSIVYPGSNPFRMEIETLSDLYAAGPTGSTISYTYYERA